MGFYQGRLTFLRFQVKGARPRTFDEDHLARLSNYKAGTQRIANADGVEYGWSAGDHILDTDFDLAKNIINDTLHFEFRIDVDKLPSDLMRAYYAVELKALSAKNPSGFASAKQKREAREVARERLEHEAKDGRYRKRKAVPILWDCKTNEVLFGATSITHLDAFSALFNQTFGLDLEAMTAGSRAYHLAELGERTRQVDDSSPSSFVPGTTPDELAWIADGTSRDFLGNEFLLWLWWYTEIEGDSIPLMDDTDATLMLTKTLTLECPRAQTGHETITHEAPNKLPEAKRAIQSGKLPRKVGMIIVRQNQQYELTLHAETLGISGGKLPVPSEELTEPRAILEERADFIRSLVETLDLVYDSFGKERFGKNWADTLPRIQKWLKKGERNPETEG